jgi:beta-glucanase (GH16 family)
MGKSGASVLQQENARVSGGYLYIDVKRESYNGFSFTSAKLKSQGKVQVHFGKIAARIKLPYGKGMWPAFWMLGRDFDGNNWPAVGEIDIMEIAGGQGGDIGDRIVYCTMHWDHNGGYASYGTRYTNSAKLSDDFHIYEIEWTPDGLIGRIDGIQYYYNDFFYNGNDGKANNEFQFPFYLILNVAVGGTFFDPDILNPALVTAPMPQSMVVDWVRYYTNSTSVPKTWKPASGNKLIIFSETNTGNNVFSFYDSKTATTLDAWANTCTVVEDTANKSEGTKGWKVTVGSVGWMGFGVSFAAYGANLLGYTNSTLKFDIKTTSAGPYKVGIKTGAILEAWVKLDSSVGFVADGQWHTVSIPMSKFFAAQKWLDFQYVTLPFMFASDGASQSGAVIYIDNVYWTAGTGNGSSSSSSSSSVSSSSSSSSVSSSSSSSTTSSSSSVSSSSSSSASSLYTHGGEVVSTTSAKLYFTPNGWTAGYVIVHYTVNGGGQQNVNMTYNSSTGRWEYTITGLSSGATINYGFTYQKDGIQYDTGGLIYTYTFNPSSSSSSSVSSSSSSSTTSSSSSVSSSSSSSASSLYTHGGEVVSTTSAKLYFTPNGWTAGYVIVHYTVNGGGQQNVNMTYNSSTGRWEYTITGLSSGATINYGFTYQKDGIQYDTGGLIYTYTFNPSSSSSSSVSSSSSSSSSSNGVINVPGVISTNVGSIANGSTKSWTVNCTVNANYRVWITSTSSYNSRSITVSFNGTSVPISINAGQTVNVDFGWKTTGTKTFSIKATSDNVKIGKVEMVTY